MEYIITGLNGKNIGKKVSTCECVELTLEKGEMFSLEGGHRGLAILITEGRLWVTQEGDPEDYKVDADGSFTITSGGKVVLQGLPEAKVRLVPADNDPSLPHKRQARELAF